MNMNTYRTLVFDCDGVVLNSNKVKTDAFYKTSLPYGRTAARVLVNYHIAYGGVSRYKKFEYFLAHIIPQRAEKPELEILLNTYALEVKNALLSCETVPCLEVLRKRTSYAKWFIASGGNEHEMRDIFRQRGLHSPFDGGIYGSPATKKELLLSLTEDNSVVRPGIVFGDSQYDHEAAVFARLDLVLVSDWTEFPRWESYCQDRSIRTIRSLSQWLSLL